MYDTLSSRDGLASLTERHVTGRDEISRVINTEVRLANRSIPVRIYSPSPDKPENVIVFIHGGGHLSGSVDVYDPIARRLAATSDYQSSTRELTPLVVIMHLTRNFAKDGVRWLDMPQKG